MPLIPNYLFLMPLLLSLPCLSCGPDENNNKDNEKGEITIEEGGTIRIHKNSNFKTLALIARCLYCDNSRKLCLKLSNDSKDTVSARYSCIGHFAQIVPIFFEPDDYGISLSQPDNEILNSIMERFILNPQFRSDFVSDPEKNSFGINLYDAEINDSIDLPKELLRIKDIYDKLKDRHSISQPFTLTLYYIPPPPQPANN